jgi:rhamnosyltransferase
MKIDGVVVLYNPEENLLTNINSYINEIDKLYVVDNSESKNLVFIEKIKKINKCVYIDNHDNQGISYALNVGAKYAIENGADWLLTMDQDSKFEKGSLKILVNYLENNSFENLGILSPFHATRNIEYIKENKVIDELTVMTSGNLLNLEAYKNVGEFEEKYFIDYVDHEYCLRLQKNGYSVKVHKDSILIHELGDGNFYDFLGIKKIGYTNHNHIRRYYITRNRLDVITKYFFSFPSFSFKEIKALLFEWLKIVLFEKDKLKKQKSILFGIKDFIINKYSKYNEK